MRTTEQKQLVLVVDDHPRLLRFLEIDLKLCGFKVVTASSGEQALELVRSVRPDIMVLDIVMPEIDGFEVLRRLRGFTRLPVIAFSANPSTRGDALSLGADDFIIKPFHPDEMVRRIEALLPAVTPNKPGPLERGDEEKGRIFS